MAQNLQFQRLYSFFKQQMSVVDNMNSKNSVMDRLITSNIRTLTVNKDKELSLEQKLTSNDSSAQFNVNSNNFNNGFNEMEVETSSNKTDLMVVDRKELNTNDQEPKEANQEMNIFAEEQKNNVESSTENQNGTETEEIVEIEMITVENKEEEEEQNKEPPKSIEIESLSNNVQDNNSPTEPLNEPENQQ